MKHERKQKEKERRDDQLTHFALLFSLLFSLGRFCCCLLCCCCSCCCVVVVVVLVVTEHVASEAGRGLWLCLLAGGGAKLNEFWLPHTAKARCCKCRRNDLCKRGSTTTSKSRRRRRREGGETETKTQRERECNQRNAGTAHTASIA